MNIFSEDHNIFRASVRKFVEKEIKPRIDQWEDEELFPVELYRKVSDVGLLGFEYPEACCGIRCDKFMNVVYTEEMIAAVRTCGPGYKGVSLLMIDAATPGFSVAKKIRKMGWNASGTPKPAKPSAGP